MESRAHIAVYLLVPPVCVVIAIAMQLNAETGAFFFLRAGECFSSELNAKLCIFS